MLYNSRNAATARDPWATNSSSVLNTPVQPDLSLQTSEGPVRVKEGFPPLNHRVKPSTNVEGRIKDGSEATARTRTANLWKRQVDISSKSSRGLAPASQIPRRSRANYPEMDDDLEILADTSIFPSPPSSTPPDGRKHTSSPHSTHKQRNPTQSTWFTVLPCTRDLSH